MKDIIVKSWLKQKGLVMWKLLANLLSIGRPKDRKNNNSVSLQEVLEPHYIHKVDEKTGVDTDVDTNVDLKLLPHSHLIDMEYKVMEG